MCEYARFNDNGLPICLINKELCTLCVIGNSKTYNEIKEKENKYEVSVQNNNN